MPFLVIFACEILALIQGDYTKVSKFRGHCVIELATLQLSAESPYWRSKEGE